jgi:hypothetical protein
MSRPSCGSKRLHVRSKETDFLPLRGSGKIEARGTRRTAMKLSDPQIELYDPQGFLVVPVNAHQPDSARARNGKLSSSR